MIPGRHQARRKLRRRGQVEAEEEMPKRRWDGDVVEVIGEDMVVVKGGEGVRVMDRRKTRR